MSGYDLPTSAEIGGKSYAIRSDYRAILDIMAVMGDSETEDEERTLVVLSIFYEDFQSLPMSRYKEALDYMMWFVNGGENRPSKARSPKLMDWEQDFPLIVAPVNRVIGKEIRSMDYLHWWSFLSAYREIGDCLFAQIVGIRKQKRQGKKLDKSDEQFYRENRHLVDFKIQETASETEILEAWT